MKKLIVFLILMFSGCTGLSQFAEMEGKYNRGVLVKHKITCYGITTVGSAELVNLGPQGLVPAQVEGKMVLGVGTLETSVQTGNSSDLYNEPKLKFDDGEEL